MIFKAIYILGSHYINVKIIFYQVEYRALCPPLTYIKVRRVKIFNKRCNVYFYNKWCRDNPQISTESPDGMFSRQVKFKNWLGDIFYSSGWQKSEIDSVKCSEDWGTVARMLLVWAWIGTASREDNFIVSSKTVNSYFPELSNSIVWRTSGARSMCQDGHWKQPKYPSVGERLKHLAVGRGLSGSGGRAGPPPVLVPNWLDAHSSHCPSQLGAGEQSGMASLRWHLSWVLKEEKELTLERAYHVADSASAKALG